MYFKHVIDFTIDFLSRIYIWTFMYVYYLIHTHLTERWQFAEYIIFMANRHFWNTFFHWHACYSSKTLFKMFWYYDTLLLYPRDHLFSISSCTNFRKKKEISNHFPGLSATEKMTSSNTMSLRLHQGLWLRICFYARHFDSSSKSFSQKANTKTSVFQDNRPYLAEYPDNIWRFLK